MKIQRKLLTANQRAKYCSEHKCNSCPIRGRVNGHYVCTSDVLQIEKEIRAFWDEEIDIDIDNTTLASALRSIKHQIDQKRIIDDYPTKYTEMYNKGLNEACSALQSYINLGGDSHECSEDG